MLISWICFVCILIFVFQMIISFNKDVVKQKIVKDDTLEKSEKKSSNVKKARKNKIAK